MPYIPSDRDTLKFAYTFTLGLQEPQAVSLKSSGVRTVGEAFDANVVRLKHMLLAPALIGDLAQRVQRCTDIAELEITGTVAANPQITDGQTRQIFDRMKELFGENTARLLDRGSMKDTLRDTVEIGGATSIVLSASWPGSIGFEALLRAYITNMWTAFETLAGDLWEVAVNEKPDQLARLNGKAKRLSKGRPKFGDTRAVGEQEGKSIRLDLLQYHGWNLTGKMGTVLKQKFEFSSLEGIRRGYASAFEKADDIDEALSDDALDIISALRNAIVHRGGKADGEYLMRRRHLPALPIAPEGQPIPLDGEIISKAIGEAIFCSQSLLVAVDGWIEGH